MKTKTSTKTKSTQVPEGFALTWLLGKLKQAKTPVPDIHVVLGSGLASAFADNRKWQGFRPTLEIGFAEFPGLAPATVVGHKGVFRYFVHEATGKSICFQLGRLHGYEGHRPRRVVLPVICALLAGTRTFLLTNAAGGLKKEYSTGSVMVIRDHVNMTGKNPLIGPNPKGPDGRELGPRFPDMSESWDRPLSETLKTLIRKHDFNVFEGTYLGLLGPTFETPAEVRLYAQWGMDAVGMSTVWEAIALKHAGAKVAGVSVIANPACGLSDEPLDHEKILKEMEKTGGRLITSFFELANKEFTA